MKENSLRKDGLGIVDTNTMELVAIPQGDSFLTLSGKEIDKALIDLPRGTKVLSCEETKEILTNKEIKAYW